MRMRKRRNLTPRMEQCAALMIEQPEALRGRFQAFRRAISSGQAWRM